MVEHAHQRDQTSVAPAEDTDPIGVDPRMVGHRPVAGREAITDLTTAVVDILPEVATIAR